MEAAPSGPTGTCDSPKPSPCDDPFEINLPGVLLLNSKPAGGKSHMLRYLFYKYRNLFSYGIVFSRTAFRAGNLDYVPDYEGTPEDKAKYYNFKHMRWNPEKLKMLLSKQASFPDGQRPLAFVIFDDNISEKAMWEDPVFIDLVTTFRHFNVFVAIASQYINKVCTTCRECATDVGLFKMDSRRSIEAAYDAYGVEFTDYKTFKKWLDANTTPPELHNCCWKDKANDKPWRIVRAPAIIPKFRLEYGRRDTKDEDKGKGKRKRKRDETESSEGSQDSSSDEAPKNKRRKTKAKPRKGKKNPFNENMDGATKNLKFNRIHPYIENPVAAKYMEMIGKIKTK